MRRVRDSADRRVVHLVYPPEARALARRYSGPLARAAETARGRFDDAQLTTIASFLRTLDAELAARHETPNGAS
ncbi:hypothetical protein ACF09E_02260 [Streptomyces sp. NPDC014891]|uniref:hypothetical protein n=1 Tax=Streptomyces sp. NPDC014891 TaxID=3364929 RepID=UPI0036F53683